MKSMNVKKVGSIIAGTAVVGAALSTPVLAGMDSTGIDKGFFYDANYNPIVQIVVGEKGMATDAVAAGNIAATIGNLAYMTKTVTAAGPTYTPEGQVVITTAARGAVGAYVQDENAGSQTLENFYDDRRGFSFDVDGSKTSEYEKGDFMSYTMSCETTKAEAGVLMTGSYKNIHCLFCHNLCMESLENPAHDMKEKITVNASLIKYYEDGLGEDGSEALKMSIGKNAIKYTVKTDYIPLKKIVDKDGEILDFEYRGKMLLFGEEYYVKDVDKNKIYLSKGKVLDDVTSEGFTAEYKGYKFKVDHLIYAAEYQVAGILLDVQKPDGTIVQVQISKMANGLVDNIELAGVYAEEAAALQSAQLIAYDLDTQVILEDGEDLKMGGKTYEDWEVKFTKIDKCSDDSNCDIDEYDEMDEDSSEALLKQVDITYTKKLDGDEALEKDESLAFPNKFKLTFKGYMDRDYREIPCSGAGEGNIVVERGDSPYQMIISFTGNDNNRYNKVRMDEGPFKKGDLFLMNKMVYKFASYSVDKKTSGIDADDQIDLKLDPQIRGTMLEINDMQRYCNPKSDSYNSLTYTGAACGDDDIKVRLLALTDAMDDDRPTEYDNDDDLELDPTKLYIKADAVTVGSKKFDVIYYDSDKTIFFAEDFTGDGTDTLKVNGDLIGTFDDFDTDGYDLKMSVTTTAGTGEDLLDFESIVVFETADGDVTIDMYDREHDDDDDYENSLVFESQTLDEDRDTVLIVPEGGDKFTVDWGSDNRIDAVEICHPVDKVDATYFIGTDEEETVAESIITKADEGKEITAACCTFTVSKFDVNVGNVTSTTATSKEPASIVGAMVVAESAADTTKNLIIVGGPSVNGMATVTKEEISAAADKYIVKKDGNKIIVAGWEKEDTIAAGNALIAWLKANAH